MPRLPYVAVPKRRAERARRALARESLLVRGVRVRREGDRVLFPVEDAEAAARVLEREEVPFEVGEGEFESVSGPRSVEEVLEERLGVSCSVPYDVVGDVAVVQIPEELEGWEEEVGRAIMEVHGRVRAVFARGPVRGVFRVRELRRIAGEGPPVTEHREHGCRFRVDLSRCYFNPRLATERRLLAEEVVEEGSRVLDMFAGVGPITVILKRFVPDVRVVACELNPVAYRYLLENLELNRVSARAFLGDAGEVVGLLGRFDYVIMNAPKFAHRFLRAAARVVRSGGRLVYYRIAGSVEEAFAEVRERLGEGVELESWREVKPYSPEESLFRLVVRVP
ncbi:MAG: class I SAM-dependent methyltransferase family protein [Euryarchaeota archaeon]